MDAPAGSIRRAEHRKFYAGVADELREYAREWVKWETTSPKYKARADSNEYKSMRWAHERAGQYVPPVNPPVGWEWLVDLMWRLKRFVPDVIDPITPGLVTDYGAGVTWHERELLFTLDQELRDAMARQRADNDRWQMEKGKKG